MENHQYFPSESNDSFYTSTSKLESVVPVNVTVRDDHTKVLMANPQVSNTFTITSKETRMPPQGIHIQAPDSNEIVVFGSNEEFFSVDGFLALPCPWLQVEQYNYYTVSTWSPPSTSYTVINSNSAILIVSCNNGTQITFTPTATKPTHATQIPPSLLEPVQQSP